MSKEFRVGDADHAHIFFVGACPGIQEGEQDRPFSPDGRAGKSLRVLVKVLHEEIPCIFASYELDHYSLLNAHPKVRRTGTPSSKEIIQPSNLERLIRQLQMSETVVALGNDAEFAVGRACRQVTFKFPHPTSRKFNSPKKGSWIENWRYWVRSDQKVKNFG